MGFPAGMQLATIAFGIPLTATGKDVVTTVTVKPTARVIWAATGQPLPEFEDSFTAEAGQLGQFQVPFVDQAGFIDSSGATVTDFAYQVTASWSFGNARPITWSKNLKPLLGQTGPIDLDLIPDGPVSIPVTAPTAAVLGFGGRTGFVTLQESDLPARLSDASLNATYVPKWKANTAYIAGDKVLSPGGDVVSAKANFTSGASYNAANWDLPTTYTQQWKANMAYTAGQPVVNPSGDVVTAKASFTSGATYDAANWNLSPTLAGKAALTDVDASQRLRDDRADQAYNALRTFRRALLTRDTTPVNMWHIGDSITLGVAPATPATRWASVLRDKLRLDFPTAGNPVGGFGFYSANAANNASVVTTGGVLTQQGASAFSPDSYVWRAYVSGDKQVYTFTGTGADILYWDTAGDATQAFYWKVDGGASTNVVTGVGYTAPKRVQVRGLAAGTHTIEVGWAAGASYSPISGIIAYNGDEDKGFRSIAAGISGATASTWDAMATGPYEFAKLYAPDLVTIGLGTNDYGGTVPITAVDYKAKIQSMISKIKARTTGKVPSFVIMFPAEISKASPLAPFADYRKAAYEIADADPDNVTVQDWGIRLNPVPTFNSTLGGLLHTDYVHPTQAGHAYIARMEQRFLPTGG